MFIILDKRYSLIFSTPTKVLQLYLYYLHSIVHLILVQIKNDKNSKLLIRKKSSLYATVECINNILIHSHCFKKNHQLKYKRLTFIKNKTKKIIQINNCTSNIPHCVYGSRWSCLCRTSDDQPRVTLWNFL